MSRKIVYLINPISGTGVKASLQELVIRRTTAEKIDFQILPTDAEGNYAWLNPLIEKENITDIVICGGDGTVSAVAAALMGTSTRIGIIPMGSGNGLAFAAHIPAQASRALDIIFAGKASPIDGFTINGRFSCMLCGIGFDAKVAHEFARQKKRGLQTYIRVSLRQFFRSGSYRFQIRLPAEDGGEDQSGGPTQGAGGGQAGGNQKREEGHSFPVEAFFISLANGNQFGNHVTIAPKARLDDGLIDIVIVKRTNKLRLILAVLTQVMGGNMLVTHPGEAGNKTILYFEASELVIENPEEAPLHIDGDPRPTAKEFVIRIIPKAFTLIQP
jgi:diacylglycerol kinase (ATP)